MRARATAWVGKTTMEVAAEDMGYRFTEGPRDGAEGDADDRRAERVPETQLPSDRGRTAKGPGVGWPGIRGVVECEGRRRKKKK